MKATRFDRLHEIPVQELSVNEELYLLGFYQYAVGALLPLKTSAMAQRIARDFIRRRQRIHLSISRRNTPRNREIVTLYENGLSIRNIASQYGFSFQRVQQILTRENVTMRLRGSNRQQTAAIRPPADRATDGEPTGNATASVETTGGRE